MTSEGVRVDEDFTQGETWDRLYTHITNGSGPTDLSTWTGVLDVRVRPAAIETAETPPVDPVLHLTSATGEGLTLLADGTISWRVDLVEPGEFIYALRLTDPNGVKEDAIYGHLTVEQGAI